MHYLDILFIFTLFFAKLDWTQSSVSSNYIWIKRSAFTHLEHKSKSHSLHLYPMIFGSTQSTYEKFVKPLRHLLTPLMQSHFQPLWCLSGCFFSKCLCDCTLIKGYSKHWKSYWSSSWSYSYIFINEIDNSEPFNYFLSFFMSIWYSDNFLRFSTES